MRLQFVTSDGFTSRAIRMLTWSDYSHVDLVLPDGRLLGARMDGVAIRQPDYYLFTRKLTAFIPGDTSRVLDVAYGEIGKPYDYAGILNFALQRDWRNPQAWFCSELVAYCFEQAGYPLLNLSAPVYRVTPRDLLLSPLLQYEKSPS